LIQTCVFFAKEIIHNCQGVPLAGCQGRAATDSAFAPLPSLRSGNGCAVFRIPDAGISSIIFYNKELSCITENYKNLLPKIDFFFIIYSERGGRTCSGVFWQRPS
jgi:hypothetical protein